MCRYFNTVGSKEGWTPSTFVSSRSNRKKDAPPTQQNPEDFMDEEDMAEAEEARKLQTTDTFAGLGSTINETSQHDSFMDILKTSGETMGIKLLKKMGWREGQGVGPKVNRKARLEEDQVMDGEAAQQTHLFAPEDSSMISFIKKNDKKGLGFEGESKLAETQENTKLRKTEGEDDDEAAGFGMPTNGNKVKKKKPERRGGFGVGILNDNGSGDEDPYAMGPQISYNRIVGGGKKKKKLETSRSSANSLLNSKPVFVSKKTSAAKASTSFRRCHDGRLPLEGFVLPSDLDPLSSFISQDGKYPPPTIPQDWKSSKTPSQSTPSAPGQSAYQSSAKVAAASRLSPKSRASLLGETPLPGKSVFDYLTPGARTRIASATNNDSLPPALNEASAHLSSHPKTLLSLVPPLALEIAQAALGRGTAGWMPYAEDLGKRARYRNFVEIHAGIRPEDTLPDRHPDTSNGDWVNEMNEFVRAAQVFKPMTGVMATRFTSSNVRVEGTVESTGDSPLLTKPAGKVKTPAEEAAAVGMYGPLTRSSENFYPTRLLCKRFNVQPPAHVQVDPGAAPPGADSATTQACSAALPKKSLELVGKEEMNDLRMRVGGMRRSLQDLGIKGEDSVGGNESVSQAREEAVVVDPERNEALERERPGEAVFKAIFGSDSEDD